MMKHGAKRVWSIWSTPFMGVPAANVQTLGQIAQAIYGGIGT